MREQDVALWNEGDQAWEAGDWARAGRVFADLAARNPGDANEAAWWFNAALAHKNLRDWPSALELGRRAAALVEPGTGEPAFWNLGIAATALRDWATARQAWIDFGIDGIDPGEDSLEGYFGPVCIRLDPATTGEVVWGRRICPTRAVVLNVPMACDRRFGDVILHDGVPDGERVLNGHPVPVFDEIEVWQRSELPTWAVEVSAPDASDHEALHKLFASGKWGVEAGSAMNIICECCSHGSLAVRRTVPTGTRTMWLAAPADVARDLLARWRDEAPDRRTVGKLHTISAPSA
ncbi:hypothetical protein LX15_000096 [Streptoalloteichus tenebrarius]|uniref:Tetratricopeptide repeat protein n=1 Tax=Streptoalloteichus tenebrarius (strain ATCC 17920 / DSM 40477 / JCM 4838 / CBS 697.72 / NBRC 16177 / NCIMB 11028 / NRRL B-12390 / A12253. 1 / ISP 5477) TaxID=1933 RepID=A0ABT1HLP2_STRSD|nr:tetratricopeptide repeat protein [Streptoalloteichus tenebrarius]MCP2256413.1 hypothetical protein [Streptoalloteichus tenebrarius]BFF04762.1 hypothetical protein GCM10020241_64370 [Streptoalloteichus tenebrarius]